MYATGNKKTFPETQLWGNVNEGAIEQAGQTRLRSKLLDEVDWAVKQMHLP